MTIKKILLSLGLLALPLVAVPAPAAAYSPLTTMAACNQGLANFIGLESWDSCLRRKYGGEVRITHINDVWLIITPLLDDLLKIGMYVAVAMIIWGGMQYVKSKGEPGKTAAAKDTVLNAVIGLVICLLSVAIVQFIAGRF